MDRRNGKETGKSADRRPAGQNGKGGERKFGGRNGKNERPEGRNSGFRGGVRRGANGAKPRTPAKETLPTARDAALQAFREVARKNAYAAQALDRALTSVRLSDEDRRLAAGIFYFTLENRLRIEHLLSRYVKERPEPEIMEILDIAAAQILYMDRIPDHAAVDEAVKQTRKAHKERMTGLVNAVLRSLLRDRDAGNITLPDRDADPAAYVSEKWSVAPMLAQRLIDAYGAEVTEQIVSRMPDRRVAVVRPNYMRMNEEQFGQWLTDAGFRWEKGIVPGAFRVQDAGRIASHEGYRKGDFSIQGECSMLAAYAVEAKPGMQVLDACAAPGGKSCLLAERMKGAGRVFAWELHDVRTELIRAAAKRLELDNIRPQTRDASKRVDSLIGEMDAVLVDAPCSGLGVMGEKPDIKYRLSPDTIDALVPIQRAILDTCAQYVRPGGRLVYSTCTIMPEENRKQVEAFLADHPEYEADPDTKWLPEQLRPLSENGMLQTLPGRDGIEGFFIARMRRKAVSNEG